MEITKELLFLILLLIGIINYLGVGIIFCFLVELRNDKSPFETPFLRLFGVLVWLPALFFWIYKGTEPPEI